MPKVNCNLGITMLENINLIFNRKGLGSNLNAARIVSLAQRVLASDATVLSIRDGKLKLGVSSSVKAQDLKYREEELIGKINQLIVPQKIEKIIFKVGG